MIFCPQQPRRREKRQLLGVLRSNKEHLSAGNCSNSNKGSTPNQSLPAPGSPISILEFSELSPSQQKQWMEGNPLTESEDDVDHPPPSSPKQHPSVVLNNEKKSPKRSLVHHHHHHHLPKGFVSIERIDLSQDTGSSGHTSETESLSSLDEDGSAATTSTTGEESSNGMTTSSRTQRAIFAPYWASTGQQPLQFSLQEGKLSSSLSSGSIDAERTKTYQEDHHHQDESQECEPIAAGSTNTSSSNIHTQHDTAPATAGSLLLPGGSQRRSIFGFHQEAAAAAAATGGESTTFDATPAVPFELSLLSVPDWPLSLLPNRKVRSASELVPPSSSSILKRDDGKTGPRQRRHSFSVTFDSKIDVVVFQDPPSYQEGPWWVRLVAAATGAIDESV